MCKEAAGDSPRAMLDRLAAAVTARDLEGLVDCFADDYVNETPAHPARGFSGREQVRANWAHIFAGVPDVRAAVLRAAVDGDLVWSEWEMSGTRRDGGAYIMAGVILFHVADGRASSARFYLEPVHVDDLDVDAALRSQVAGTGGAR